MTTVQHLKAVDCNTVKRLSEKVLGVVEGILDNVDARPGDRLKAAALAASWCGLDAGKLVEQSPPENLDSQERERKIEELQERRRLIKMKLAGMREIG